MVICRYCEIPVDDLHHHMWSFHRAIYIPPTPPTSPIDFALEEPRQPFVFSYLSSRIIQFPPSSTNYERRRGFSNDIWRNNDYDVSNDVNTSRVCPFGSFRRFDSNSGSRRSNFSNHDTDSGRRFAESGRGGDFGPNPNHRVNQDRHRHPSVSSLSRASFQPRFANVPSRERRQDSGSGYEPEFDHDCPNRDNAQ